MKKSHIVSNIEKYYLNGLTKEVVWNLVGSKATIDFATETKDAVGQVVFDMPLPDGPLAIYSTDALLRLINITSEEYVRFKIHFLRITQKLTKHITPN